MRNSTDNKTPSPRKHRDLKKAYPNGEFGAKLNRLAIALDAGKPFSIQVAGQRLYIPADVRFNAEHEREGWKEKLEFQLLWRHPACTRCRSKPQAVGKQIPHKP